MSRKEYKGKIGLVKVTFKYMDEWTNGEWQEQCCVVNSVKECKEIYGLDDCEYRIISVEEV